MFVSFINAGIIVGLQLFFFIAIKCVVRANELCSYHPFESGLL